MWLSAHQKWARNKHRRGGVKRLAPSASEKWRDLCGIFAIIKAQWRLAQAA